MQNSGKIHVKDRQISGKFRREDTSCRSRKPQARKIQWKKSDNCDILLKNIHKGIKAMTKILFVCHGRIYRA